MIGALHKRNSCVTLHPPGGHYSKVMSKSKASSKSETDITSNGSVSVKRCHSSSKVEKSNPTNTPAHLKERLYAELQGVAQSLCLIESMIPCMRTEEDSQELVKQLRETNRKLQQILPALHVFMTLPPPAVKEEKERLHFEKKKLSREFESALTSYKLSHKTLNAAVKRLKTDVVAL